MPNVYCCITGCSNSVYQLKKWKTEICLIHRCNQGTAHCTCPVPFSLFPFPSNSESRDIWIKFVNRRQSQHSWKRWEPNKDSRICSDHFVKGRPTEQHPHPTITPGYTTPNMVTPRRSIFKHEVRRLTLNNEDMSAHPSSAHRMDISPEQSTTSPELEIMDTTDNVIGSDFTVDHTYFYKCTCSVHCTCVGCKMKDQQIKDMGDEIDRLMESIEKISITNVPVPLANRLLTSDRKVALYTGLPSLNIFQGLFDLLKDKVSKMQYWHGKKKTVISTKVKRIFSKSPKKQGPPRKLQLVDEYLLTLMKLRQGTNMEDLSDRFGIALATASSIFNTWIRAMSNILKGLIFLPPRDVVLATMPNSFKEKNCKSRVIIDCTEVFIERPRNLQTQALTWSDYKHNNTVKFLVGITPHGHIAFLSKAWGGRTPDQHIVKESGFLDLIDPGDEIMADRGFQIKEQLLLRHATLTIPPSSKGKVQMSSRDVKATKHVANLRIHVERAINRIKWFRILKTTLPLSLVPCIDDIACVCGALCNLRPPLVSN